MKNYLITALILVAALAAESANSQTRTKKRHEKTRKVSDTSATAYKQRRLLRITDTTGIGILHDSTDTTKRFLFRPRHPRIPPQNNPNPHSPNPTLVNPNREATPATTKTPPDSTAKK
ncbi:hypothetical protein BDE36_2322 [Arcticibacter tournemirensis]|uniref:Uncharacterized protein n=1 Tax=Arcticibacter tournemirensis TaxID=699437 RepID=A0A5M9HDY1_9SPHI|nr:hypothetical protein [Arcticibacter tournemirensis]KAA8484980.1 hypothetical protein F1649_04890 [Arcticibacter tournemirensis]TQM50575.1 hypothetical protein BDE36_2322 [Arcticibacter tournemirensis]